VVAFQLSVQSKNAYSHLETLCCDDVNVRTRSDVSTAGQLLKFKWHSIFSLTLKYGSVMGKNKDRKPSPSDSRNDRERNDALNKSEREGEKKLPGEYPANEDIMNRQNMQRVGLDVENFARGIGIENYNKAGEPIVTDPNSVLDEPDLSVIDELEQPQAREMERPIPKDININEDNEFARGNESDVTEEDLQALGPKDLSMDMGEDEALLKNRVWPVDMAAEDLDVPGVPDDNNEMNQAIGPEDEENDFYSLGGDRHEDNLEGK
jgi:hypothetical protein